jgi:metal-dependent amidase/aminoacylase/carboxypeptidase family protein
MMHIDRYLIKTIQEESSRSFEFLRKIRRDLHAHPELSGQESWTANYVEDSLKGLNVEIKKNVGGYGLIADLVTDPNKPTVALRVDMDALPLKEANDLPYQSKIPGVMHACGHDVHITIGIGTAALLNKFSNSIPGNIRLIFQPEEEQITGAKRMIRAGVLEKPTPKAIFGLHVAPLPAGQIAWTDGLFLAGFDHYLTTLIPNESDHIGNNYLDAAAQRCCTAIQQLNQWHLPETWEEMQAFWDLLKDPPKSLKNFIIYDASLNEEDPDSWHGEFGIGVKAATPHLRHSALGRIRARINRISRLAKLNYHIEPVGSMIDMRNDQNLVSSTMPALKSAVGEKNLVHLKAAFPFNCEDFAYYTKEISGAMVWLGAGNPEEKKFALLHTPDFDVDESCLITGTTAMTVLLIETLLLNS